MILLLVVCFKMSIYWDSEYSVPFPLNELICLAEGSIAPDYDENQR